jgi:hypothetical protein
MNHAQDARVPNLWVNFRLHWAKGPKRRTGLREFPESRGGTVVALQVRKMAVSSFGEGGIDNEDNN